MIYYLVCFDIHFRYTLQQNYHRYMFEHFKIGLISIVIC